MSCSLFKLEIFLHEKAIEGGIDMGTSTGDIVHDTEQNIEKSESRAGELNGAIENSSNDGGETSASALPNGKNLFQDFSKINKKFSLDEGAEEREEEQINAEDDAGGEQ